MNTLMFCAALLTFSVAKAQDNVKSDKSGNREQIKPSQVEHKGKRATPVNDSGWLLNGGISVGQAMPTEDGSPELASFVHFLPGYQQGIGSWGRIEFGVDFFAGQLRLRHADNASNTGGLVQLPIPYGLMPQFGYGYTIGNNMLGVSRVGVGLASARLELGKLQDSSLTGLLGMVGWDFIATVSESFDLIAGWAWTHWQFDVGQLDDSRQVGLKLRSSGKVEYNRVLRVNSNEVKLGFRMRL